MTPFSVFSHDICRNHNPIGRFGFRAPLPTLVLNDRDDPLYTVPEMKKADAILRQVFAKAGAPEHYRANFYPGPHKFDVPMQEDAFAWFDQFLK